MPRQLRKVIIDSMNADSSEDQPDMDEDRRAAKTIADADRYGTVDDQSQQADEKAKPDLPATEIDENATVAHESSNIDSRATIDQPVGNDGTADDSPSDANRQQGNTLLPTTPSVTTPEQPRRGRITSLPDHIGRYQTIDRLGEGSFGIVLKARDPNLDREVAIKLQKINPLRSEKNQQRFRIEAKAAASLRHPCIVPVYEFGEFGGNQFIVYEYIRGRTLDRWLQEEQPDLPKLIGLIAMIANALDYAHSLKIIHRDIKPANILVADETHIPHVADFGCAKLEQADTNQTVDGTMLGTPPYMSPEVIEGYAGNADARSDLWSIGVVLYEALVGERPFQGKVNDLRHKITRLSPKRPRHLQPQLPVDLETITLKCLEKEPERRYQSCGDLAVDLDNWLNGRPISARRVGPLQRTWMWSKRNPVTASLLATIAVCLVALAAGSAMYSVHMRQQRDELVQRRIDALYTASPQLLPELIEDLNDLDPQQAIQQLKKIRSQPDRSRRELFVDALTASAFQNSEDNSNQLLKQLSTAEPEELKTALAVCGEPLSEQVATLRTMAGNGDTSTLSRSQFAANCLLANLVPDSGNWSERSDQLVGFLLAAPSEQLPQWCQLLRPVNESMRVGWMQRFRSPNISVANRAAEVVAEMYDGTVVSDLALDARPSQLARLRLALRREEPVFLSALAIGEKQIANWQLVHALRGNIESWCASVIGKEQSMVRSYLIRDCASAGLKAETFVRLLNERLEHTDDATGFSSQANELAFSVESGDEVSAYVLALGQFNQQQLYESQRRELLPILLRYLKQHRSVAVHSACRWLINRWGFEKELSEFVEQQLQTELPRDGFQWHEDVNGICFAVFEPASFTRAADPATDGKRGEKNGETDLVHVEIPRRFGIAIHETRQTEVLDWETKLLQSWQTLQESETSAGNEAESTTWAARIKNYRNRQLNRKLPANPSAPMSDITWHTVALFCNGLTRRSNMPDSEDVYGVAFGKRSFQAVSHNDSVQRKGYRMPTPNEWEYAARANSSARYFFGDDIEMLDEFGWSVGNSAGNLQPVGQLMPNLFGMFDVHGNAAEWCHQLPASNDDLQGMPCDIRDQSCAEESSDISLFRTDQALPALGRRMLGFRVARTY